jgi:hypothetical protein
LEVKMERVRLVRWKRQDSRLEGYQLAGSTTTFWQRLLWILGLDFMGFGVGSVSFA